MRTPCAAVDADDGAPHVEGGGAAAAAGALRERRLREDAPPAEAGERQAVDDQAEVEAADARPRRAREEVHQSAGECGSWLR